MKEKSESAGRKDFFIIRHWRKFSIVLTFDALIHTREKEA